MKSILGISALSLAFLCTGALAQSATQPTPAPNSPTAPTSTPATPQPQAQPQSPATAPPAASQAATTGSAAAQHETKVAPGSVIPVQLTKTIDAKKAKTGDEVVAKVTQDMKTSNGDVLLPKDTKVLGHVTEAQSRNKEQKESQMGLAFDRAVLKDGQEMNLPMSIQAVIGQQNPAPATGGEDTGASASSGGATPSASGSRTPGMAGATPPPSPSPSAGAASPSDSQNAQGARPPITGQTQGVVGISNLTLAPAPSGTQGSVITSDKNNVKLESGTMLLLKVNQ